MSEVTRTILKNVKVEEDGTVSSKVEMTYNETKDEIESFQDYGFASVPKNGSEGITVTIEGASDHYVTIATEDGRYRLKGMENGEVAIYTDEGDYVHLKRGNQMEIKTQKCTIDAPLVECTGTLKAAQVEDSLGSLAVLRAAYNSHLHSGVRIGTANSGPTTAPVTPPPPV